MDGWIGQVRRATRLATASRQTKVWHKVWAHEHETLSAHRREREPFGAPRKRYRHRLFDVFARSRLMREVRYRRFTALAQCVLPRAVGATRSTRTELRGIAGGYCSSKHLKGTDDHACTIGHGALQARQVVF